MVLYFIYALLGLWCIAILGSICKELPNDKRIAILIPFSALTLITLVIFLYFSQEFVFPITTYTTEKFGQFGDFTGGILNPIFGFLTVILLLHTLRIEKKSLDATENREHSIMIDTLIVSKQKQFTETLTSEPMYVVKQNRLMQNEKFYLSELNPETLYDEKKLVVTTAAQRLFDEKAKTVKDVYNLCSTPVELQNYRVVWRARKNIEDIRKLYIRLIHKNSLSYYKEYQLEQLTEFIVEQYFLGILTSEEFHSFNAKWDRDSLSPNQ